MMDSDLDFGLIEKRKRLLCTHVSTHHNWVDLILSSHRSARSHMRCIAARNQSVCYELGTKKVGYTLDYIILSVTSTFFVVGANLYFYLNIQIAF